MRCSNNAGLLSQDDYARVFVCEHGTVKSVVAMAWFARLALVQDGPRADDVRLGPFTPRQFSVALLFRTAG